MAETPRISVVMPLYNKAAYVQRAIESVLMQSDAVSEVIVVDDGSTDDSVARVEAMHCPKVRLVRQNNGGVSAARKRGIEEAKEDFICFLDADDVYLSGFVEEISSLIDRFPTATVYATGYLRRWPDGHEAENYLPRVIDQNSAQIVCRVFRAWSRSSFFHIGSSCVRKRTFFEHDIFFPMGENVGEDQDVIFRLFEVGNVAFSPRPLMAYTQGVADSLYNSLPDYVLPCYRRLAQRIRSGTFPAQHKNGARRVVSVSYLNVARLLLAKGKRAAAARLMFSAGATAHQTYWIRICVRLLLPSAVFKMPWLKWI